MFCSALAVKETQAFFDMFLREGTVCCVVWASVITAFVIFWIDIPNTFSCYSGAPEKIDCVSTVIKRIHLANVGKNISEEDDVGSPAV